eukprot:m.432939 g.432939  ORF g.432939 m.432939 type:complete len:64 (-) comp21416_c1_seq1:231-422(-)
MIRRACRSAKGFDFLIQKLLKCLLIQKRFCLLEKKRFVCRATWVQQSKTAYTATIDKGRTHST